MNSIRQKTDTKSLPVALVTGATSNLGTAICRKLAEEGFRLILHYGKSREKARLLQREVGFKGADSFLLQADLSKPVKFHSHIYKPFRQWGRLDLLVNNASTFKPTPLSKANWKDWRDLFNINSMAPCALAVAARPWLEKSRGSIVNIGDIYGELPILKDHAAYCASKAALLFLTKYLAVEFAPQIRVNAVSPGVITFPQKYGKQKQEKLIQRSALKRQGTPEEIAQAVWFLASNRFITGQVLKVDGGRFIS
ncbi:MAG TPA: SDR family oxidoreductase [bacterium]|nr:SDR family oxidoreductase [bacterium]